MPTDPCTFVVKGESFQTSFAEAVVISPMACDVMKLNPMCCTFTLPENSVDPTTFRHFLNFALSRDPINLSRDTALSFIPACRSLGNERLALALLSSQKDVSSELSIDFCDSTIDICASRFYSYSAEVIRSLDSRTLHGLLSSPSLSIESEDALLGLLIELGIEKSEFWCYIDVVFLSSSGISLFAEALSLEDLTESIWVKIVSRLKGISDERKRASRFHVATLDSAILTKIPELLSDLGDGRWRLLYRGSRDGFRSLNFHEKCDGQSNTVTVILTTNDAILGGFTPLGWDSSDEYKADNTGKSFVFTLKNARNNPPHKFALSRLSHAICCFSGQGPTFGGGHDIYIADNCNTTSSNYTNCGHSYTNDTGIDNHQVLAGEYNFTVKEVEVFSIGVRQ
jgi:hypothetical protein